MPIMYDEYTAMKFCEYYDLNHFSKIKPYHPSLWTIRHQSILLTRTFEVYSLIFSELKIQILLFHLLELYAHHERERPSCRLHPHPFACLLR